MDWKKLGQGMIGQAASGLTGLGISSIGQAVSNLFGNSSKDFQREMADKAFQNQLRLMRAQNEWNKPSNQSKLMMEGGFSPSALFEHGTTISQANVPGLSSYGANYQIPNIPNLSGTFSSIGQALESLSGVDKNVAQIDEIKANIKKLLSSANLDDQNARLQGLLTNFEKIYGDKLRSGQIGKQVSEIFNNLSSAHLSLAKGDTEKTIQALNKAKEAFTQSSKDLADIDVSKARIQLKHEEEMIMSEIERKKSESSLNYSQRDVNKQLERIDRVAADIKENNKIDEMEALLSEYRAKGQLSDTDYFMAKRKLDNFRIMTGQVHRDEGHSNSADVIRGIDAFTDWLKEKVSIFNIGK